MSGSNGVHYSAYSGIDGSSTTPDHLKISLAVVGDGYVVGAWRQGHGETEGQLFGTFGIRKNDAILILTKGACTGEFAGNFETSESPTGKKLKGHFTGNPTCRQESYDFEVVKDKL